MLSTVVASRPRLRVVSSKCRARFRRAARDGWPGESAPPPRRRNRYPAAPLLSNVWVCTVVQQSSCRRIGGNIYGVVLWLNSHYQIHNCATLMDKLGNYVIITDKLAFKSRIPRGWWT